jgi:hypothetical protein
MHKRAADKEMSENR